MNKKGYIFLEVLLGSSLLAGFCVVCLIKVAQIMQVRTSLEKALFAQKVLFELKERFCENRKQVAGVYHGKFPDGEKFRIEIKDLSSRTSALKKGRFVLKSKNLNREEKVVCIKK